MKEKEVIKFLSYLNDDEIIFFFLKIAIGLAENNKDYDKQKLSELMDYEPGDNFKYIESKLREFNDDIEILKKELTQNDRNFIELIDSNKKKLLDKYLIIIIKERYRRDNFFWKLIRKVF